MIYRLFAVLACLIVPCAPARSTGAHDGLSCVGCHAPHAAKSETLIFAVGPNSKDVNKRTGQPHSGVTALCLGCHQAPDKGGVGIKPIASHMSHPYGLASVNKKVANVPAELLKEGKFECTSCHDPHPSNANYKYLRVDTAGGSKMDKFCAACHPMKVDAKAVAKPDFFSSMDESRTAAPPPKAQ